jgi:excisionase family DNA binding protein
MPIRDLATHPAHYVTIAELAEYWAVSRKQILKPISSGALPAIRIGSRLLRVRTQAALEFERQSSVAEEERDSQAGGYSEDEPRSEKLPKKIGLQRMRALNGG